MGSVLAGKKGAKAPLKGQVGSIHRRFVDNKAPKTGEKTNRHPRQNGTFFMIPKTPKVNSADNKEQENEAFTEQGKKALQNLISATQPFICRKEKGRLEKGGREGHETTPKKKT